MAGEQVKAVEASTGSIEVDEEAISLKKEGDRFYKEGDYTQALQAYIAALSIKTDFIEAHRAALELINEQDDLGYTPQIFNEQYAMVALAQAYAARVQSLMVEKKLAEARTWCEKLCQMVPENGEVWMMMGMLCISAEKPEEAVKAFVKALDCAPDNSTYRNYTMQCLSMVDGQKYDDGFRRWVKRFMQEIESVDINFYARVWHNTLLSDSVFAVIKNVIECKGYKAFACYMDGLDHKGLSVFTDPFFLDGLRYLIIADMNFEIFLTHLRRYLLENLDKQEWATPTMLALAMQCFNNEYVFFETDEELTKLSTLMDKAEQGMLEGTMQVAILACYRPLYKFSGLSGVLGGFTARFKPAFKPFMPLIIQQVKEPQEELRLKAKLKVLGKVDDEVSRKVQAQYEEYPYPRWIRMGYIPTSADLVSTPGRTGGPLDILIAGCATGQQPIGVARKYPKARVVGLDLSKTSLSYAERKAMEYKSYNLQLIQGDILEVKKLGRVFDYIECVGVLHHMEKPETGWQALCDVLKPEGIMRIGLYSETARRYVVMCQNYIKDRNIPGTDEGIRAFRHEVADLPEGHDFRNIFKYMDFYTMSMCRDMLFHVQEHRYNIPQIKESLNKLGLEFRGFVSLNTKVRMAYTEKYDNDPEFRNLNQWEQFEQDNPDTFLGMYVFNCSKKK